MKYKVVKGGQRKNMRGNRMKNNLYWQKQVKGDNNVKRALGTKKKKKAFFKAIKAASKERHGRLTKYDLKGVMSQLGEGKDDPFTRTQARRLASAMGVKHLKKRYAPRSEGAHEHKRDQRNHDEQPQLEKKKPIADFSGMLRRGARKDTLSGIDDAQWQEGVHVRSGTLSKSRHSFKTQNDHMPSAGIDSKVSTSGNRSAPITRAGSLGHLGGEATNLSNRNSHSSLSSFTNRRSANDSHYGSINKAA